MSSAAGPGEGGMADEVAGEERRERRSRDRYGRDRRERGVRSSAPETAADSVPAEPGGTATGEIPASDARLAAAPPPAPTAATAQAAAAVPQARGLPRVQRFDLPLDALKEIANSAGLQWINSDSDKVQEVQRLIAAEPRPVHVPRERPPAVVIDEGPLVLVETRRDLAELKLPIDSAAT